MEQTSTLLSLLITVRRLMNTVVERKLIDGRNYVAVERFRFPPTPPTCNFAQKIIKRCWSASGSCLLEKNHTGGEFSARSVLKETS